MGATWEPEPVAPRLLATGTVHTCHVRPDGTLWCWGDNEHGQLGNGVVGGADALLGLPLQVVAADESDGAHWDDWVAVDAGVYHTCGIRADGSLWCWGDHSYGQLGSGHDATQDSVPHPVRVVASARAAADPWSDWEEVSLGHTHTCGRRSNGSVWCWGARVLGDGVEAAQGTVSIETSPVRVLAAGEPPGGEAWDDWVQVSSGFHGACGRRSDGTLWCWGRGSGGYLGDGNTHLDGSIASTPTQVLAAEEDGDAPAWSDWVDVALGSGSGCGVRQNGTAWCWGNRGHGRLGDGRTGSSDDGASYRGTPTQVLAAGESPGGDAWTDWLSLRAGGFHVCGWREDGSLWCWGSGNLGRLGTARGANEATPARVLTEGAVLSWEDGWQDWVGADAGGGHTCGARADGSSWCWGVGDTGQRGDGAPEGPRAL
jgi:alpha-tubulin suppressor-like RCC1 family protein